MSSLSSIINNRGLSLLSASPSVDSSTLSVRSASNTISSDITSCSLSYSSEVDCNDIGKSTVKQEPLPCSLLTVIYPSCNCTNSLVKANPIPEPIFLLFSTRKNRSNILSFISGAMPIPWSII